MKKIIIISLFIIPFTACFNKNDTSPSSVIAPYSTENSFSFDGVKLIATEIEDGTDTTTYSQKSYFISLTRRLMMRFESLSAHEKEVDADKPVKLLVTIVGSDRANQIGSLTVCPIERDWMMLATWRNAHPFGIEGKWDQEGGDLEKLGCVNGALNRDYPDKNASTIEFNMTQWFLDFPRAKQINYGLVLVSSELVQVAGEKSPLPPRISINEWHKN